MGSPRVAVLSVHTSPMDQPGSGDSGGMNVYIRAVTERLADRGVAVDLFTRCRGGADHDVREIAPGIRVVSVKAGPCTPVPKAEIPRFLPEFLGGVLRIASEDGNRYDIVHSHYWLSGWVGRAAKEAWGAPLVASFHTLGKVKNYSLARGEAPEPEVRLAGEQRVIDAADRILAPTPAEAAQLVGLYRAHADHLRLVPPGVDHTIFLPRDRERARERLHLSGLRLALYVGRLQAHKGPDVAVRTLAEAVARDPDLAGDLILGIVGGPSGDHHGAELTRLMELATALGVNDRVMLFPPQPQAKLVDFYAAADVVLVPSRSESFGLVALEAQACGTPVVASAVGGLKYVVEDGRTGWLVEGHDPGDHAERLLEILGDPALASRMGREAARQALRFTWDATADELLRVYRELIREPIPALHRRRPAAM
jgi:D-inositol-3-phosphate glycosyltransferase